LIFKIIEFSLEYECLPAPFSISLVVHNEINSPGCFDGIDMLDDWINLIEFDIQSIKIIYKLSLQQYHLNSSILLTPLSQHSLWNMTDILGLNKHHHQHLLFLLVNLQQLLLCSKEYISIMVNVSLIG